MFKYSNLPSYPRTFDFGMRYSRQLDKPKLISTKLSLYSSTALPHVRPSFVLTKTLEPQIVPQSMFIVGTI